MKNSIVLLSRLLSCCGCLRVVPRISCILLCAPSPVEAGVREAWLQRYTNTVGNMDDVASGVVRDKAGDLIVTGYTRDAAYRQDALVIKYSAENGTELWRKRVSGPAGGDDAVTPAAVDGNDNLVVAGYSSNGSDYDYYAAKYAAADGALIWEVRYDGPVHGRDQITAVAVDSSGNVVVTGSSGPDDYDGEYIQGDCYTAKYAAADGALLWERRIPHPGDRTTLRPPSLALDASGNAVVAGFIDDQGNADIYTVKYAASDGTPLWERRYDGPGEGLDFARAVAVDSEGNAVVAGSSTGSDGNGMDYYTAKYAAADGAILWERRYAGPGRGEDTAEAVALDGSGNVVVTGRSVGARFGDFYTAKYAAADGALLWEQRYAGLPVGNDGDYGDDGARAVAVDGTGNVVVTGYSTGSVNDWLTDYYTAMYAAGDGALLWEKRYEGPRKGVDAAVAVTVDSKGNAVVTGNSASGMDADIYTAAYAAADGTLRWEQRYAGSSLGTSTGQAVAVDKEGNVIVAGSSEGDDTGFDFVTTKYSPAGAVLWQRRYDDPVNGSDYLTSMALDAGGNVVVTGYSDGEGSYSDYYTAKYAAADGALLWEHRYDGPGNFGDYSAAVAVDSSGNVAVTGYSTGSQRNYGYYTAKYAAADGKLLWERRYNSPVNGNDWAAGVAVDASGNVAVTGSVWTGMGGEIYTVKYAAADGALIWEKNYHAGGVTNEAIAVVMDNSGNVLVTGRCLAGSCTVKYAAADGTLLWENRHAHGLGGDTRALAVDANGNAVVTGYSYETTGAMAHTAKFAAANGALLWVQHTSGPDNSAIGKSVALDEHGNVVISGSTWNGTSEDILTAKYAAADGAVLWEQYYDGPVHLEDVVDNPRGLALGPDGMVAITGSSWGSGGTANLTTIVYRELPPPHSFAEWAAGLDLSGAAAAPGSDPDNDGLPNAVEFVLGGDPSRTDASMEPAISFSGDSAVFTFHREDESETPDVTLTVEASTDLDTWPMIFHVGANTATSSPGVTIVEDGGLTDTVTVTIPRPPGVATQLFARLKVVIGQ